MADLHGWQADPFGLHEQRYFSQGQPTKLVRDQGRESYDPPPATPIASVATPAEVVSHMDLSPISVAASSGQNPQPPPGWWLASDGNWYPPELAAPVQPTAVPEPEPEPAPDAGPPPGWWLASDGNWYPPELAAPAPTAGNAMAAADMDAVNHSNGSQSPNETSRLSHSEPQPGWWLASDGNWYPPELAPGDRSA